jgi:hypothetical protein
MPAAPPLATTVKITTGQNAAKRRVGKGAKRRAHVFIPDSPDPVGFAVDTLRSLKNAVSDISLIMDDGTIKHSARAARTIAKTTGKAIDAGRELGGWLNKIFGKAIVNTVGLYWTDRVVARRIEAAVYDWKRLRLLIQDTEKELKRRGVKKLRPVPAKVALPLIEHATMENERRLHKMWTNLLAAALTPADEAITQTYVTVLGELTARDARMLEKMYIEWIGIDQNDKYSVGPIEYETGVDVIGSGLDSGAKLHRLFCRLR